MSDEERHKLLIGLLDQELDPDDLTRANDLLIRDAAFRAEYEELAADSGKLESLTLVEPEDAALENLWTAPYSRGVRNAGLVLMIGGYVVMLVLAFIGFWQEDGEGIVAKLALSSIVIGFVMLLLLVGLQRMKSYKVDRYKEIER